MQKCIHEHDQQTAGHGVPNTEHNQNPCKHHVQFSVMSNTLFTYTPTSTESLIVLQNRFKK